MARQRFKEYSVTNESHVLDLSKVSYLGSPYAHRQDDGMGVLEKFFRCEVIVDTKTLLVDCEDAEPLEDFYKELKNDLVNGI